MRGHAADETESFQDYGWKMLARQARRTFSHLAAADARVWDEQLDDVDLHRAWRRQQRLVGLKPSWNKVAGPTGAIILCLRQMGLNVGRKRRQRPRRFWG